MEIVNTGVHCDHPECKLMDFLPFKCDACQSTYCLEHHKYDGHDCPIGRSKHDVVCPTCPLCHQVVSMKRGDDGRPFQTGEEALASHQSSGCVKPVKNPKCVRCRKSQLIPFQCERCDAVVCVSHRHPDDHKCNEVLAKRNRPLVQVPLRTATPAARSLMGYTPKVSRPVLAVPKQQQQQQQPLRQPTPPVPSVPQPSPVAVAAMRRAREVSSSSSLSSSSSSSPALVATTPCLASPSTSPSARISRDGIPLEVLVRPSSPSRRPSEPCRVVADRSWTVEATVRALASQFGISPQRLGLMLSDTAPPLPSEVPLQLLEDELRGVVLRLDSVA